MPTLPPKHHRHTPGGVSQHDAHRKRQQAYARQDRRALPTWSAAWKRIRRQVLARQPLCVACLEKNRVREAIDVDHIDGDATNNDLRNLQGLCRGCHSRKTGREVGERRRRGTQ